MPNKSTEPLTKVTLNLFRSDVIAFKRRYGQGYTEQIRLLLRENVKEHTRHKQTIESLMAQDMVDGED